MFEILGTKRLKDLGQFGHRREIGLFKNRTVSKYVWSASNAEPIPEHQMPLLAIMGIFDCLTECQ